MKTRQQYRKEWLMKQYTHDEKIAELEERFSVDKLSTSNEKLNALQTFDSGKQLPMEDVGI